MMLVRKATQGDTERIVEMGAAFYATTKYAQATPYDETSAAVLIQFMRDSGILLVAEHSGAVIGMVGLVVAPFAFNMAVRGAHEVMWWVEPDARDSGAGLALLRAVDEACAQAGVVWQEMKSLATSPEYVGAIYERFGYALSETSYTKVR
jgi:L-amino acid N-acyltransferase YncA